jgi:hypothetical protein
MPFLNEIPNSLPADFPFSPDFAFSEMECVLLFDIAAIQLLPSETGEPVLGSFVKLPRGLRVRPCGEGINSRTVRVTSGESHYFVFRRDLNPLHGV